MADDNKVIDAERGRFKQTIEASLLTERLAKLAPGDMVTYAELGAIIGVDVREGSGRSPMRTARRRALRDHNVVLRSVPTEGYRRLLDEEASKQVPDEMRRGIRSKARKGATELLALDDAKLTSDGKRARNVGLSMAGALTLATSPTVKKKLERACEQAQAQLPVAKTLDEFTK